MHNHVFFSRNEKWKDFIKKSDNKLHNGLFVALFYEQFGNFADGTTSSMTLMHRAARLEKAWHWEQENAITDWAQETWQRQKNIHQNNMRFLLTAQ